MTPRSWLLIVAQLTFFLPVAQAGILEDLLARPAIQALLGRQSDIQGMLQKCVDSAYRKRNEASCQQVEDANRLAKVPPELRAVLAVPASAASIRELCLAAQVTPARNSYLCAELTKGDLGFAALVQSADKARALAAEEARQAKEQAAMKDRQLDR